LFRHLRRGVYVVGRMCIISDGFGRHDYTGQGQNRGDEDMI